MQIARQAERMAAQVDVLLQRVSALLRVAHHRDTRARTHLRDAGPQMRRDQFAVGQRQFLDSSVRRRTAVVLADKSGLRVGHTGHQRMGRLPGFILGLAADDLQAHAEADVVLAAVARSTFADVAHVGGDRLGRVAPEQVHIGVTGRQLPGFRRATAEVEAWVWSLQWLGRDPRAVDLVVAALEGDRPALGPQRLEDADLFVHQRVALFLGQQDAVLDRLGIALPGDQVDRDPTVRQLVHRSDHPGQQHRVHVARARCHQHADRPRARQNHRRADVGIPAGPGDGHQQVLETGFFSGSDHPVEHRHRRRHRRVAIGVGRGITGSGQEPAKLELSHLSSSRPQPV